MLAFCVIVVAWLIYGGMLDFNAVEAVVDATHRYKEIFYESND